MSTEKISIQNDPELLRILMEDMERQDKLYKPTPYWQGYCKRIVRELDRSGLSEFRRKWNVIKGYEYTPLFKNNPFLRRRVDHIIYRIMGLPFLSVVRGKYDTLVQNLIAQIQERNNRIYSFVYYFLQTSLVGKEVLKKVDDSGVGNPIAFMTEGRQYTENILNQIVAWCLLSENVDTSSVKKVMEIGVGYGAFAEIIGKLKSGQLEYFIGIDIPPVLYVATQYLKAVFPGRVVDYKMVRDMGVIRADDIRGKFVMLPPWTLPRLSLDIDLLWSIGAFQEMEKQVVGYYFDYIARTTKHIFMSTLRAGHIPGAGGQKESIPFDWLTGELRKRGYKEESMSNHSPARKTLDVIVPKYDFAYFTK
ncbi:MAG: putative sugar O-methyltransferase [bacterium]|nr:putative sugar O-methyltransferase [bacterium]